MIFENLSEKLQGALSKLRGKGKLSEKDVDLAMREVKLALLESDVNFKVVKQFISNVKLLMKNLRHLWGKRKRKFK